VPSAFLDADELVRQPDVRDHVIAHAGELVEPRHRAAVAADVEPADQLEGHRVAPLQRRRAVRHPQLAPS
jgi:hypothetical protein